MLNFVALRVAVGAIFPMVVGIALPSTAGKIVGKESAAFKRLRSLGSADAGLVVSRFSCAGRVGLFISVHCDFLVIGVRNYIIFVVTDEALVPMVGSVGCPVGRPAVRMLRCSIAAIERVTFSDGVFVSGHLKAKSPNSAYRLTDAFKRLLASVETDHFAESLEEYISNVDQRLAVFAELERASRENIGISGHKRLIQDSINVYAQAFLPGYIPLFTDFADGDRVTEEERATLDQYGIVFGTIDDMWPDAILYNHAEEKLWFIEAVTSDGEADLHKVEGLQTICNNSGKIYGGTTTTYETWKCLASRQQSENNLAPGTYIWIRECPNKYFKVC